MSVDLKIYGIRKLCDEEISEFTGRTVDKILNQSISGIFSLVLPKIQNMNFITFVKII